MASVTSGSCLCGACTYSYTDEPAMKITAIHHPSLLKGHLTCCKALCYCDTCRNVSGGTNTVNFAVPEDAFTLKSGKPKSFAADQKSGMTLTLFFCPECGTTLWKEATAPMFEGVKIVQAGTLTDAAKLDGKIDAEFYVPDRASWLSPLQDAAQKQEF